MLIFTGITSQYGLEHIAKRMTAATGEISCMHSDLDLNLSDMDETLKRMKNKEMNKLVCNVGTTKFAARRIPGNPEKMAYAVSARVDSEFIKINGNPIDYGAVEIGFETGQEMGIDAIVRGNVRHMENVLANPNKMNKITSLLI